jgi:hypothetical protein
MVQDHHGDRETADAIELRDPGKYFAFILHLLGYRIAEKEDDRQRET